jgi:gluconolactonase
VALCAGGSPAGEPIAGIGPTGDVKRLHTGLQFTEGPANDGKGNLYFTDIPTDRIYRVGADGKLSVALEPSNHANGLMTDGGGRLIACEMDGTLVARDPASGAREVLTRQYDGKRYNAPNDLVIDKKGGVYFTDPRFRAPTPLPQGKEAFYYRSPDGQVIRLGDGLNAPNGIILSPDEKTLYVVPSMQKEMMAYPVKESGEIGSGTVFCTLKQPPGVDNSGGDGLTIDTKGNLYITSQLGVQVFNPQGTLLGVIEFPEQPANVTFGGRGNRTLYATARTSLYSVPMDAQGHVFSGQLK